MEYKLTDKSGNEIDATIIQDNSTYILKSANKSINKEYNKGLERLLEIFGGKKLIITQIVLDSSSSKKVLGVDEDLRKIANEILPINDFSNLREVRLRIQDYIRKAASIAIDGGNTQKKIKIYTAQKNDAYDLLSDIEDEDVQAENETTKKQLIDARLGQGKFRKDLIKRWKFCPITKISINQVLKASHIKPWREATNLERLDENNGILLSASIDSLFDQYLISFDFYGKIMISNAIDKNQLKLIGIDENASIEFNQQQQNYLNYHRGKFNKI
jgi:hypothetical protein